jgi:hypothetical protein
MNGDLISREALTDVIDNMVWYHVNSKGELVPGATSATGLYRFGDIMDALENAPAVEAEPVVHAHWIKHTVAGEDFFGSPVLKVWACNCSACGLNGGEEFPRCPHCGAHMDEEVAG